MVIPIVRIMFCIKLSLRSHFALCILGLYLHELYEMNRLTDIDFDFSDRAHINIHSHHILVIACPNLSQITPKPIFILIIFFISASTPACITYFLHAVQPDVIIAFSKL